MKILCVSDVHLDAVTAGMRRLEDVARALDQSLEEARKQKVDCYLCLGDLMDPDSGSIVFSAVEKILGIAESLCSMGIDNYWLAGNHDVIEDGTGKTTLSPLHSLRRVAVEVLERPKVVEIGEAKDSKWIHLVALPFCATSHAYDPAEFVTRAFKDIPEADHVVVAGHLNIPGIVPGEETIDMPRGREVMFPIKECQRPKTYLLNGHYHQRQTFGGIHIPGALQRLTFGEQEHAPAFTILEI